MKQKCPKSESSFRQAFLQKFAGKVNIISKNGEITGENGFRLPLINPLNTRRSTTMIVKNTSKKSQSLSSQGYRAILSKSGIITQGAERHLMKNKSKVLTDMSNSFLKVIQKDNHKKSTSTESVSNFLIGTSASRILESQRLKMSRIENLFPEKLRYSEYDSENCKTELEGVKKKKRTKRYFI